MAFISLTLRINALASADSVFVVARELDGTVLEADAWRGRKVNDKNIAIKQIAIFFILNNLLIDFKYKFYSEMDVARGYANIYYKGDGIYQKNNYTIPGIIYIIHTFSGHNAEPCRGLSKIYQETRYFLP
jgi:hypothetical protein